MVRKYSKVRKPRDLRLIVWIKPFKASVAPLGWDRSPQVHVGQWFTRAWLRGEKHAKKRQPSRWGWGPSAGLRPAANR